MAEAKRRGPIDSGTIFVGIGLLGLAALTAWDAGTLTVTSVYGMGPQAVPYLVAGGLVLLALGHVLAALRGAPRRPEDVDWRAVLWIGSGLAALIAAIGLGAGFVPAVALLFAATARAFGRDAIAADLAIGLVLGLLVYLGFTKLLTLSLPLGPLERLL
jgi:putative tricarboxylic transport membrane protein